MVASLLGLIRSRRHRRAISPGWTIKDLSYELSALMRQYNSRLILVTHPRITRGKDVGTNKMAGGAAYERFSQCVLWLRRHDSFKKANLLTNDGVTQHTFERTLKICKARNGSGAGREIAFTLNPLTLRFEELGLMIDEVRATDAAEVRY
jgi:hypothetical protein